MSLVYITQITGLMKTGPLFARSCRFYSSAIRSGPAFRFARS